jgi:hypothetical protein
MLAGSAGLGNGGAVFARDDLGQRFRACLELVGELAHVFRASVPANVAPSLAAEGSRGSRDSLVNIGLIGGRNACPDLFGSRVGDIDEGAGSRLHPLTTNKEVVGVHLKCRHEVLVSGSRKVEGRR